MLRQLLEKVVTHLVAPFSSWKSFLNALAQGPRTLVSLDGQTAWPYLISSLVIAWVIFRYTKSPKRPQSFLNFMFPREIYLHRSATADYKYAAVALLTQWLFVAPLASIVSYAMYKGIRCMLPASSTRWVTHPTVRAALAVVLVVLISDLTVFVSHYLMHRVPVLWQFHKLHHSAEVLTPVTVYRVHPVEDVLRGAASALITAITGVFFTVTSGRETSFFTIYGVNGIVVLFYIFAYQLRHSHVWLSYGPVIGRVLISPAQHQIHHSVDPKHINKNHGNMFAFWDLVLGTLYVPAGKEQLQFGLPEPGGSDFHTVSQMYLMPFVNASRLLIASVTRGRSQLLAVFTGNVSRKGGEPS